MIRIARRTWGPIVAFALALLTVTCRREQASVEQLYTTRTLGQGYLQRNQLTEAEAEFKKLTELAPDDPLGFASLGLTYLQAGRFADAETQLDRARKLDPTSTEIGLALAKLYALTGRSEKARTTLEQLRQDSTGNAHVLFALAELDRTGSDPASADRYRDRLRGVLAVSPANLAVHVRLADAFLRHGDADSTVHQLEEIRRIPPELPTEARASVDSTIQLLRAGNMSAASASFTRLRGLLEVTAPYQASLDEVKWTDGPIPGRAVLNFAPKDFVSIRGVRPKAAVDVAKFVDATLESGLPRADAPPGASPQVALAAGDVDGDGRDDLFVSAWSAAQGRSVAQLYRVQGGSMQDVTDRSRIALPRGATFATFADVDNDGWLDLFAIGGDSRAHLFHNRGDGTFDDATAKAAIGDVKDVREALFVDLDHDGDLDLLLVGGSGRTAYRNNLDGTFTDVTAAFGIAGSGDVRDAAYGDFDGDGRIDLFFANAAGGDALLRNGGAQRFSDATSASGLGGASASGATAVSDYGNDGFLDLFVVSAGGGEPTLWRNDGHGVFQRDTRSSAALRSLRSHTGLAAAFVDYDNDGYVDLVVGTKTGLSLFRNDGTGTFIDRSSLVPADVRAKGASAIVVADVDDDGDEDLVLTDATGAPRLLRNDQGNANLAVNVELKGLRDGSGKNNAFGIGARVELRAGEIYQTRVATGRRTHFGLGPHLKADVVQVEWPNGLPQTIYFPGTDQDVVENETLKGSCAFAYTWDGKRFRFVTDAMWRSALGMPLGLMGGSSAFAPAGASQEYVRIPGDALQPRDGKYVMQLTEELWETAYADEVRLIAVDHPDSVDVFVDERFVPPGPVELKLFHVGTRSAPLSAVDDHGLDVLPALRDVDDVYVSNFTPTRYQGVVEPHDLVLDLGHTAGKADARLFLRGWIYPTDASINVALAQQPSIPMLPLSLETRDANGKWHVVVPNLGFPSGKDKTMVIDLAGKFPTTDHHVRLRTSMQIYWDQAFVAPSPSRRDVKLTTLAPVSADLHERGFSRMYRKGGRYGPYWFAYEDVTKESPWRPIDGAFTRFGDVLPLLRGADDMYIVMKPGDETTIQFDASSASNLPKGWTRDFLLYTDGWIKDSDLNTAFGTTVGPLPFHGVKSYPYGPSDAYPTDPPHQGYLREYNTRLVK